MQGSSSVTLSNSIFSKNRAGNIYTPINCANSFTEGGGNYQWPFIKPSGFII
jgi:hypothetical protein